MHHVSMLHACSLVLLVDVLGLAISSMSSTEVEMHTTGRSTPLYDVLGESTKENPRTPYCYMERTKRLSTSKLFPGIIRLVCC